MTAQSKQLMIAVATAIIAGALLLDCSPATSSSISLESSPEMSRYPYRVIVFIPISHPQLKDQECDILSAATEQTLQRLRPSSRVLMVDKISWLTSGDIRNLGYFARNPKVVDSLTAKTLANIVDREHADAILSGELASIIFQPGDRASTKTVLRYQMVSLPEMRSLWTLSGEAKMTKSVLESSDPPSIYECARIAHEKILQSLPL